jgi:hypothetical protein
MAKTRLRGEESETVAMATNAADTIRIAASNRPTAHQYQAAEQELVESLIRHTNGRFAQGVIQDFHEALAKCDTFSQRQRVIRRFKQANR